MAKNWLITGGCGFIGRNFLAYLLKEDPQSRIRMLDDLSVGSKEDLQAVCSFREISAEEIKGSPTGVDLVVGDIRNVEMCRKACAGIDIIVHLAAKAGVELSVKDPRLDMETNVIGTFNMLEAARQCGASKFIFASSGAPLGECVPPINEEKVAKPISPYGAGKLAGEAYCLAYYKTFGTKTVALRFGNVYGPGSKHKNSVVAKFFKQALTGETLEIFGDGNQTRDFIFIEDLIQAIVCSVRVNIGGEIFQIATHRETSVNEIAQKIKEIVEKKTKRSVRIAYRQPRVGDMKRNFSDITKARTMLGFDPLFDLKKGLLKTFDYYMASQENFVESQK